MFNHIFEKQWGTYINIKSPIEMFSPILNKHSLHTLEMSREFIDMSTDSIEMSREFIEMSTEFIEMVNPILNKHSLHTH